MTSFESLKELMEKAGYAPGSEQTTKLLRYLELLEKWNRRINLTSSTHWSAIGLLFSEAVWAAGLCPKDCSSHLDIGSGAGFPALIMRILKKEMKLDLVESRSKKAAFLETVVDELDLTNTRVHNQRLQQFLTGSSYEPWDCISWKAVKLSMADLTLLTGRCKAETMFWMFHGKQSPLADVQDSAHKLRLIRREDFPEKIGWHISIFQPEPTCFT